MEVPPGNEQVAALEKAALRRAEQNRIQQFKKKMKELIGKPDKLSFRSACNNGKAAVCLSILNKSSPA
jgi:hypothetical protein